jgi:hypothetical protein
MANALRSNTDRFSAHSLSQFALAVDLVITVQLIKGAKRRETVLAAQWRVALRKCRWRSESGRVGLPL